MTVVPPSYARQNHEVALVLEFIARRRLFGLSYWGLQPDYFDVMPASSGVFLLPAVPTHLVFPGKMRPGDIDLLIIPYEGDELILHRAMAIEFKIVRASFARQSKSPNDFGFSQARHLQSLGFPYVTVGHIIISDESPSEFWQEVMRGEIAAGDELINRQMVRADMLPSNLLERAFGRLKANSPNQSLGLLAAYMRFGGEGDLYFSNQKHTWMPEFKAATLNPKLKTEALNQIELFFREYGDRFFDTPRHEP